MPITLISCSSKKKCDSVFLPVIAGFLLFVSFFFPVFAEKVWAESDYVGSEDCRDCHQSEYQQWQTSDHFKAMQVASANSVLGDFSNTTVTFHQIDNRLYQENGRYWIETLGADGKKTVFEIKYTFGFYPLQQYLVETGDGHIQALNVAWDSRSKDEGGQHWFHLQPNEDISPEHPFFWPRHFQNWNSRCSDCHSTNVDRNYSAESHSYNTTWSEINVACESCHGAGKKHVGLANSGTLTAKNTGFQVRLSQPLSWQYKPGSAIAEPIGEKNDDHVNMCGSCHALRTKLSKPEAGEPFHDNNRLHLLDSGAYFVDGQVREEAFVMGSFLQSKMFEKGVTCGNCHNVHTGKVLAEGNGLCAQCHNPQVFDNSSHHHHAQDSEGAACVNCHMPERTFMQVDARRDHSFTIPRPELSQKAGVPNSCTTCHQKESKEEEKDSAWASEQLAAWGVKPDAEHWAHINHRAQSGDILVTRSLAGAVEDTSLPGLTRASLLQQFAAMPSRVSMETAQKQLLDKDPLVRRAAISALSGMNPSLRWQLLSPLLKDESRSVRFQLAETLADVLPQLPADQPSGQKKALSELVDEYRESLAFSADSPATQLSIAMLEMRLGNVNAAGEAYQQALRIEPNYVPALINIADFYRITGQEYRSRSLYEKALEVAPDSGSAHHSYGLFLVRQKNYAEALPHLAAAIEQADAQPRYVFVYAVALDNQGQTDKAVKVLTEASQRWPNQYDLLMTLIHYLEKTGNTQAIYRHLSALTAIAPGSPDVKRLVEKYSH